MASSNPSKTLQSLEAIGRDLSRLRDDVDGLLEGVRADGAPILAQVQSRLASSLDEAQGVVAPLVAILGGGTSGTDASSTTRRGRKPASVAPKQRARKKRGGRGVKANLTAAQIDEALASVGGVKAKAAATLGVSVPTFNKYLAATKAGATKRGRAGRKGSRRPVKKSAA